MKTFFFFNNLSRILKRVIISSEILIFEKTHHYRSDAHSGVMMYSSAERKTAIIRLNELMLSQMNSVRQEISATLEDLITENMFFLLRPFTCVALTIFTYVSMHTFFHRKPAT